MKQLVIIITILLGSDWIYCQTIVRGQVKDENGDPLPGANVFIDGTYDGSSSDAAGEFEFTTNEQGPSLLRVEYIGFEPVTKSLTLSGDVIEQVITLKEAFNQLEAVTITAGSFEAGDRKRAIELTSTDIATTAGAMGDIVAAINTLPGTSRVGESGRLHVRGGSHEETKTFIDDLLVGSPYFSGAPNLATRGRFNPFLFNGTIFNTGGYSAEYGQALSSVLLLNTTNEKIQDELNVSLIGALGGDLAGTKSWNDGSATVSAMYFNIGPYIALVDQNQDWIDPMAIMSNEISVKQKIGKGMLKWYSNISNSRFSMYQNDLDNPGERIRYAQDNTNYFGNSSYMGALSESWTLFAGLSATRSEDKISLGYGKLAGRTDVMHAKASLDHQRNEKISLKFGADYFLDRYDNSDTTSIFRNDLVATYLEANIYTSTKLVFRIGGRGEYSTLLQRANFAPRISAAYKIDDDSQVSLASGKFYQSPASPDLSRYRERPEFELANHVLLNYQRTINKRLFRAELYYKHYDQLIRYDEPVLNNRVNYSNTGNGYAYGVDVFFRDAKTFRNGHYWISYSFLNTERKYRNFPARATPSFASKHNFSLVYKHFSQQLRSMISADVSYVSARRYHDPNLEGFQNARIKPSHIVNLSWAYLFRDQIIFYSAVTNVLGTKNQFGDRFASAPGPDGRYAREPIVPAAPRFFLLGVFFTFSKDKTRNQLDKIN